MESIEKMGTRVIQLTTSGEGWVSPLCIREFSDPVLSHITRNCMDSTKLLAIDYLFDLGIGRVVMSLIAHNKHCIVSLSSSNKIMCVRHPSLRVFQERHGGHSPSRPSPVRNFGKENRLFEEDMAFSAILFKNLLLLQNVKNNPKYLKAMQKYANEFGKIPVI